MIVVGGAGWDGVCVGRDGGGVGGADFPPLAKVQGDPRRGARCARGLCAGSDFRHRTRRYPATRGAIPPRPARESRAGPRGMRFDWPSGNRPTRRMVGEWRGHGVCRLARITALSSRLAESVGACLSHLHSRSSLFPSRPLVSVTWTGPPVRVSRLSHSEPLAQPGPRRPQDDSRSLQVAGRRDRVTWTSELLSQAHIRLGGRTYQ